MVEAAAPILNPDSHASAPVTLLLPLKDDHLYLGDITASVGADGHVLLPANRLMDLLSGLIDDKTIETLRTTVAGQALVETTAFQPAGILIRYDPRALELVLSLPAALRSAQTLAVRRFNDPLLGVFEQPAKVSAYLNIRGASTHVERGSTPGWGSPVFFLDGAARLSGVVFENQMIVEPGAASGHSVQRQGTRLIYDNLNQLMRWTALDLQTVGRGFQSPQDMAGLSVFRSYSALQPQTVARPRGNRKFSLQRPSSVEVYINDQVVRRLELAPGTYDLIDFPFARGANSIRLIVTDDSGHVEVLRFNLFIDQTQLSTGLSEFGLYGGVKAPLGPVGPQYSNDWQISGFYRRGINDALTLGANVQADANIQMAGFEAVVGTGTGVVAANLSVSTVRRFGAGYALAATYQKSFVRTAQLADIFNLSLETRSKAFAPLGITVPRNPYGYELGMAYTRNFSPSTYGGLDARYSLARAGFKSTQNYRTSIGWRVSPNLNLTTEIIYQDDERRSNLSAFVSLTLRLGAFTSTRADYDTRDNQTRVAYQTLNGTGVGAYNLSADLDHTDLGSAFNFAGNYTANRLELGANHFSTTDRDFQKVEVQRTTVRFATAIAFADGSLSVGRPVNDGFAIIVPYKTLKGTKVLIDPSPFGYRASSGWLRSALDSNLSAFSARSLTVDAPNAPAGLDLGKGTFRILSPYKSGYRLQVGSEYSITALGILIDRDALPLSLVAGQAIELARPEREPLPLFTNRDGRFGLTGLRPGHWRITMNSQPPSNYELEIATHAEGIVKTGSLKPLGGL